MEAGSTMRRTVPAASGIGRQEERRDCGGGAAGLGAGAAADLGWVMGRGADGFWVGRGTDENETGAVGGSEAARRTKD